MIQELKVNKYMETDHLSSKNAVSLFESIEHNSRMWLCLFKAFSAYQQRHITATVTCQQSIQTRTTNKNHSSNQNKRPTQLFWF